MLNRMWRPLVFSRRLSVRFARDGHVVWRQPSTPGEPGAPSHPYNRLGNKRFLFAADQPR